MSPEVLDGLARAFTRDGYVIVEGVLSPVQLRVLRAECDAVTRRYALLGGHPAPRLRDSSAPSESEAEAEDDADPSNAPLEWLSRDFGCVLEVPGCCGCCPPPDPLTGGYRSSACAVTRPAVDATLAPDGPLGALARALLSGSGSARPPFAASSESSPSDDEEPQRTPTGSDADAEMCLFNDQYIVKPPSSVAARFAWHRDSQYRDDAADDGETTLGKRKNVSGSRGGTKSVPYVSLWTALDDVDALNGCVRVLPYPSGPQQTREIPGRPEKKRKRAKPRDGETERLDPRDSYARYSGARLEVLSTARWREDLSAEEREDAAEAFRDVRVCAMRAGDTLCMSDRVMHCSGPNASAGLRRAWMPQFSARAMRNRDGNPTALAVPAAKIRGSHARE